MPTDWSHVEKFPLTTERAIKEAGGVVGFNWYEIFDAPIQLSDGHWYVGVDNYGKVLHKSMWGRIRGGHCWAFKPRGNTDPMGWWPYYDQDDPAFVERVHSSYTWKSGGCTGFGVSRMMSQLNRRRYDPYFVYHEAQKVDEWAGTDYEGSSVNAALSIARIRGLVPVVRGEAKPDPYEQDGIFANRWITDVQDWKRVLRYEDKDFTDGLNSWGESYPHIVRWPDEVIDNLMKEDGEISVVTDR